MTKRFNKNLYKHPEKDVLVITNDGVDAVQEAMNYLDMIQPQKPLKQFEGLNRAAREIGEYLGQTGKVTHTSQNNQTFLQRVQKYGSWAVSISENITFSESNPKEIILNYIIDDGNLNREHRKNLLNPVYNCVGVYVGSHKVHQHCCVLILAAGFQDKFVDENYK